MISQLVQRRTALASVMAATLVLAACAQTHPSPKAPVRAVVGSVDVRDRMEFPADAVLVVELRDASRADANAPVVAQQAVRLEGLKPPFKFTLPVEPSRLNPAGQYSVSARITRGNQPMYINESSFPVLTQGAGVQADLMLVRVGP